MILDISIFATPRFFYEISVCRTTGKQQIDETLTIIAHRAINATSLITRSRRHDTDSKYFRWRTAHDFLYQCCLPRTSIMIKCPLYWPRSKDIFFISLGFIVGINAHQIISNWPILMLLDISKFTITWQEKIFRSTDRIKIKTLKSYTDIFS